ncbi:transcription initiation factor IIB-like [Corticium candelabrum]|uniref:transcription initiation factor IIB-like n=1 Tax=Corticium candelabrum TaxID=121492 RepID=UPI002E25E96F|nr:transcription initiation factor IIB-like [Corticium candelabrum]
MTSRRNPDSNDAVRCPNHPGANLVEDYHAGDMVCPECGIVVGDRVVDVGSEWRTFSNEKSSKDNSRVGAAENPLLGGGDLSTGVGHLPHGGDQSLVHMIQHRSSQSGTSDRSLVHGLREISQMADRINLPRMIVDGANVLFKQVDSEKHLKGRSNDAIASACLYIACRQEQVPRTFKEICAVSKVSKKEIGRCFKLIKRAVETKVGQVVSTDFMSRFCANLGLSPNVQRAAMHIAKKANELDLCPGKVYTSIAAAAIYLASQTSSNKKSQKEVGAVVGVAETTIRATYKLIYPAREQLFPEDYEFTVPLHKLPTV